MRIIKTAKYGEFGDVAQRYLNEYGIGIGIVRKIFDEQGEAAAEIFLMDKGVSYSDARACLRALKHEVM